MGNPLNFLVTTGLRPLCIGSTETFELSPSLNGIPWLIAGGNVTLELLDPLNNLFTFTATIDPNGYAASVNWTVAGNQGEWLRTWIVQDANGIKQVSNPIQFQVISSPS